MREKIAGVSKTLTELLIGILFWGIVCQIVGSFLVSDKAGYSSGLWVGILCAMASAIHMWWSIDRGLDYDENTASRKIQLQSIIRYAAIVIVMAITMVNGFTNPLAAFLGIMGLKVAAYLQPFTHKLLLRFFKNKAES